MYTRAYNLVKIHTHKHTTEKCNYHYSLQVWYTMTCVNICKNGCTNNDHINIFFIRFLEIWYMNNSINIMSCLYFSQILLLYKLYLRVIYISCILLSNLWQFYPRITFIIKLPKVRETIIVFRYQSLRHLSRIFSFNSCSFRFCVW